MVRSNYREGSRRSKALDLLALEGIDCIPIPKKFGTFLAVNLGNNKDYFDDIRTDSIGCIMTDDDVAIEAGHMGGYEIMELSSKFKLKEDELYDVIKISYPNFF